MGAVGAAANTLPGRGKSGLPPSADIPPRTGLAGRATGAGGAVAAWVWVRRAPSVSRGIAWGAGTRSSGSDSGSGIFEDPAGITGRCAASWVGALAVEGFLLGCSPSSVALPLLSAAVLDTGGRARGASVGTADSEPDETSPRSAFGGVFGETRSTGTCTAVFGPCISPGSGPDTIWDSAGSEPTAAGCGSFGVSVSVIAPFRSSDRPEEVGWVATKGGRSKSEGENLSGESFSTGCTAK
jgi:hypothetical protein